MDIQNKFTKGLSDGLPIGLGYLAISFAFGIMTNVYGMPVYEGCLISLFNLTSAGQLAGLPIIATGGSLIELALTQLLINLRYSLMSVTLGQRFDKSITVIDRLYLAFALTDEVFAVSVGNKERLGKKYLLGLMLLPYIGWFLGTLLGAIAGNILPELLVKALSVAMYAMFIAIIVPVAKTSGAVCATVGISALLSLAFAYVPKLSEIPSGFVIIICALAASLITAAIAPLKDDVEEVEQDA